LIASPRAATRGARQLARQADRARRQVERAGRGAAQHVDSRRRARGGTGCLSQRSAGADAQVPECGEEGHLAGRVDELAHNLAALDLADGNLDAAINGLERLSGKLPEALINLGIAYERKGDPLKALDACGARARQALGSGRYRTGSSPKSGSTEVPSEPLDSDPRHRGHASLRCQRARRQRHRRLFAPSAPFSSTAARVELANRLGDHLGKALGGTGSGRNYARAGDFSAAVKKGVVHGRRRGCDLPRQRGRQLHGDRGGGSAAV